ncbi:MAG: PspA/IM30 family protein [Acidobacteriota bacterium]
MFDRIARFFKAVFNAILGKAESQITVPMLEQSVREMMDSMRALREATATTIAFETKAKRELDAQNARIAALQRQAEEALGAGNEKLARRALQLQVEAKGTQQTMDAAYKSAKVRADNSRVKLKIEEEKVEAKIRQLGELKAIAAMNAAQKKMQELTDSYNVDGAVSVFDAGANAIREQADKLAAHDQIAISEGEELDRQLSQLGNKVDVDNAMAQLKAKLGMAPPVEVPAAEKAKPKEKERISSSET